MSFKNFKEYLDQKGKLQTSPIIDGKADTAPTAPPRPPKAVTKGKNWKDYKANEAAAIENGENPAPYKGTGTDPGQPKYEKGLVYQGDQGLVYKPKTEDQHLKTNLNKTKTEQFIDKTKQMTPEQYANFILQSKDSASLNKITEAVDAICKNKNLIETLVRELKRKSVYPELMSSVLDQPETYKELAIVLANENSGREVSRQIAKAVSEITAQPMDEGKKSKKQYVMMRPEHHLIEALANYGNIRNSMVTMLSEEFGRTERTIPKAVSEVMQLQKQGQLNSTTLEEIAQRYNINPEHFKDYLTRNYPGLNLQP